MALEDLAERDLEHITEDLTEREHLARELERCTEHLWGLVNRYARVVDGPGAPIRVELEALVSVLHRLDIIGTALAQDLYRPTELRLGPLPVVPRGPSGTLLGPGSGV